MSTNRPDSELGTATVTEALGMTSAQLLAAHPAGSPHAWFALLIQQAAMNLDAIQDNLRRKAGYAADDLRVFPRDGGHASLITRRA